MGLTVIFGLLGHLIRKFDFEPAPPRARHDPRWPQLEASLRRALIFARGDFLVFVDRPIAATLLALILVMLLTPLIRARLTSRSE